MWHSNKLVTNPCKFLFFLSRNKPTWARPHTVTQHSCLDSTGRWMGPSQLPFPDNKQQSQETDMNAPAGFLFFWIPLYSVLYPYFVLCLDCPPFCLLSFPITHNTNIHASGGIRTRKPSNRTAVDPRLRPLGHWYRHVCVYKQTQDPSFDLSWLIH